jgi:hypothetical protein
MKHRVMRVCATSTRYMSQARAIHFLIYKAKYCNTQKLPYSYTKNPLFLH